jgi:acetolactate synthase-1/2/3 large subunit
MTLVSERRLVIKGRQRPFRFSGAIPSRRVKKEETAMDKDETALSGTMAATRDPGAIELSGAEMVVRALRDQGVKHIFGYPGGAVLPIYDALFAVDGLEHILVRHEQGAVHAAEGYARSTGKPGVVVVTSGPGATNAVTGLTDALMDSIPLVVITGQVATHLIGNDAFQECDTVGITRPCTKHNWLVKDIADLARVLHEAFQIATTGRPGPVVVDIPKDIQFKKGPYIGPDSVRHRTYRPKTDPDLGQIVKAIDLMSKAQRPIFYTGGGIVNSGPEACRALRELVKITGFPITSTLMGLGAFPASDPQWLGMLGMHGTFEANNAMHDCDLMICLGARFDDRVTGRIDLFAPGATKIHLDIDASQINKNVRVDLPIVADAGKALREILHFWKTQKRKVDQTALAQWWKSIEGWRARKSLSFRNSDTVIKPQYAIDRLFALTRGRDVYITTEVGQHQMWAAQRFGFEEPNRWMTSGGLGTMGYGTTGSCGRPGCAPRRARHRHCRRSQRADDDAGNVNGRSAQPADQDLHSQQPVHGHGAPVAAIAAWRALFALVLGGVARFRQARRSLRLRRALRRQALRARCEDQGDDRSSAPRAFRCPRRSDRELLPDDAVGRRPQRNDPLGRRGRVHDGVGRREDAAVSSR